MRWVPASAKLLDEQVAGPTPRNTHSAVPAYAELVLP
jgi:hypothetical protein